LEKGDETMNPPIVMAAFGTTSRAMDTYRHIDAHVKTLFPDREIRWAYTSRMVCAHMKNHRNAAMPHLRQVLDDLHARGHRWAVVQSLHLVCGHEFYRLVAEADHPGVRTSIGLPLLCSVEDYRLVISALAPTIEMNLDEAVVLVGHGTDHPSWSAYTALQFLLKETFGAKVYVGVVEEGWTGRDGLVRAVASAGYGKVRLVPLMLVAGVHFEEDLAGEEDSWRSAFEAAGIDVELEARGMGYLASVIDLFRSHAAAALDVIPGRGYAVGAEVN